MRTARSSYEVVIRRLGSGFLSRGLLESRISKAVQALPAAPQNRSQDSFTMQSRALLGSVAWCLRVPSPVAITECRRFHTLSGTYCIMRIMSENRRHFRCHHLHSKLHPCLHSTGRTVERGWARQGNPRRPETTAALLLFHQLMRPYSQLRTRNELPSLALPGSSLHTSPEAR